jgi:hypothetical protein
MPQATFGRPFDKPNLCHQLGFDPLHFAHVLRGHASTCSEFAQKQKNPGPN